MLSNYHPSIPTYRCLAYGILSHKKSSKLNEIVQQRKRQQKIGGSSSTPKKKIKSENWQYKYCRVLCSERESDG
jgi:hypothetical protein